MPSLVEADELRAGDPAGGVLRAGIGAVRPLSFKRLAGWRAILVIPTVVFSLCGMNFEWMPELKWQAGYPLAVGATLLGCVFVYRRLRRSGWV